MPNVNNLDDFEIISNVKIKVKFKVTVELLVEDCSKHDIDLFQ